MNKQSKPIENFAANSAVTFFTGLVFVTQIRSYCRLYPDLKAQVIKSLKLLIQELEQE